MFAEIHRDLIENLPFALVTLGESPSQNPISRPAGMKYHQLIWLKEGSGSFEVAGQSFTLTAGEGVFLRSDVPHSYEGRHFYTVWCTFKLDVRTLDYLGIGDYLCFAVPNYLNGETAQLMRFAEGESTPITRSAAGYSYVMELLSSIITSGESSLSTRVLEFLERRYQEPISLLDISEEMHTDRFSLCRIYKRERGVTVMDDLCRIRIAKAKRFLRYSTEPVERVCRLCGFESHSYFTKRFHAVTGLTPTEYRQKNT